MPKGVYQRKPKPLGIETEEPAPAAEPLPKPGEVEVQADVATGPAPAQQNEPIDPAPMPPVESEAQSSSVEISPVPRARPRPEIDRVAFNENMRAKAAVVYRKMQAGERIPIHPDVIDIIQWMRGRGVRIKAREDVTGTWYELVLVAREAGGA